MSDLIKPVADSLCEIYKDEGVKVKPSHAHALVSSYLGYNSKKALLDADELIYFDENQVLDYKPDRIKVCDQLERMRGGELKSHSVDAVVDKIQAACTPECRDCGRKSHLNIPVNYDPDFGSSCDENIVWVCQSCSQDTNQYDRCTYCPDDVLYSLDELNDSGECKEHAGESYLTEEEQEGRDSYIENINKDL